MFTLLEWCVACNQFTDEQRLLSLSSVLCPRLPEHDMHVWKLLYRYILWQMRPKVIYFKLSCIFWLGCVKHAIEFSFIQHKIWLLNEMCFCHSHLLMKFFGPNHFYFDDCSGHKITIFSSKWVEIFRFVRCVCLCLLRFILVKFRDVPKQKSTKRWCFFVRAPKRNEDGLKYSKKRNDEEMKKMKWKWRRREHCTICRKFCFESHRFLSVFAFSFMCFLLYLIFHLRNTCLPECRKAVHFTISFSIVF